MKKVSHYLSRRNQLRQERSNFDSQWTEAARRLIPAHADSFQSPHGYMNRKMNQGQKNLEHMFDSTGALGLSRFQSVIESLATPSGHKWHLLRPMDDRLMKSRAVREYLDTVLKKLFQQRYRYTANYVGQNQKMLNSYGAYGNGFLFIDANTRDGGLRYKNLHLAETLIAENHQGNVDTMYRTFGYTPVQIIQEYGENGNVPESIRKLAANPNTMDSELEILHVVEPRPDFNPGALGQIAMQYESVHIFVQEQKVLRSGGYHTFPLVMCRYQQYSGEMYGRGPAQLVLPSLKLINEEKKVVIKQGHRALDPVLLAHDDGALGTFDLRNGAVNPGAVSAEGRPLVHVLQNGDVRIGEELMEMERKTINDAFLITLFQILTENPQMTATEVIERTREKGMLIAPTAGRLQQETLGPQIEREISVLEQGGLIPPPPQELVEAGGLYSIEYDNPMSRMMRAEAASGFNRSIMQVGELVKLTGRTELMDWYNFDEAIPEINDINGMPFSWTNTPEAVQQVRAQRKEEQEKQMMIENSQKLGAAARSMSDIKEQQDSPGG